MNLKGKGKENLFSIMENSSKYVDTNETIDESLFLDTSKMKEVKKEEIALHSKFVLGSRIIDSRCWNHMTDVKKIFINLKESNWG